MSKVKFDARKAARDLQPEMMEALKAALKQQGTIASIKAAELLAKLADVDHDDSVQKTFPVMLIEVERRDGKIVEVGPNELSPPVPAEESVA